MGIFDFNKNKKMTATDFAVSLSFPLVYGGRNAEFTSVFVFEFFHKILTDCFSMSGDFPPDKQKALWDSVVSTSAQQGLITLLAHGMLNRTGALYLVYDGGFVRIANRTEEREIDADPSGKKGIKVSFANFKKATLLLVLASLVESLLINANTGLKISQSVLLRIDQLRESIAQQDSENAVEQAKAIEQGLKQGTGAMLDGKDVVEIPKFDPEPMEVALDVLFGLMSMVSGLPKAYISGILTAGLNNTGEGDADAVERGLSYYFNSIFKPVCDGLLGTNLVFKTSRWRKFAEISNLLPVLEGVGEDLVPKEFKDKLIKEIFG